MLCKQQEETMQQLEDNIQAVQQAALDAVETDSIVTGTSITGDIQDERKCWMQFQSIHYLLHIPNCKFVVVFEKINFSMTSLHPILNQYLNFLIATILHYIQF